MAKSTQPVSDNSTENTDSTLLAAGRRGRKPTVNVKPTVNINGTSGASSAYDGSTITTDPQALQDLTPGIFGTSYAYDKMTDAGKEKHKELKAKLKVALLSDNREKVKSVLSDLSSLYSSEANKTKDARARNALNSASNDCKYHLKKLNSDKNYSLDNIDADAVTASTTTNQTESTATNSTGNDYDDLIAAFSKDGTSTGKIENTAEAVKQLQNAGYTSDQIAKFFDTYCDKQNIPQSERAELLADATSKASQTTQRETAAASSGNNADRQM
jgi:hypothetical protein